MTDEVPGGIAGWVVDVIDAIGVGGIGALIALENVFPPIHPRSSCPSPVSVPPAAT